MLNSLDWDLNAVTPVFWRDLILDFIEKHIDQESLAVPFRRVFYSGVAKLIRKYGDPRVGFRLCDSAS